MKEEAQPKEIQEIIEEKKYEVEIPVESQQIKQQLEVPKITEQDLKDPVIAVINYFLK